MTIGDRIKQLDNHRLAKALCCYAPFITMLGEEKVEQWLNTDLPEPFDYKVGESIKVTIDDITPCFPPAVDLYNKQEQTPSD